MIGVGMLTGVQNGAVSERDGSGSASCPSDYSVCQLWAKPEHLWRPSEACPGHVQTLRFEPAPALFPLSGLNLSGRFMTHGHSGLCLCHFSFKLAASLEAEVHSL